MLFRSLLCLIFATVTIHAQTQWRLKDGSFTSVPEAVQATNNSVLLAPKAEGAPAFPAPFAVQKGDIVSVSLTVKAVQTESDAGAEGQAGIILTLLPASSKTSHNPDAEHKQIVIVGSEAEQVRFAFRAKASHLANELMLIPTVSYFDRTVHLENISFENHGVDGDPQSLTAATASYRGQALDAPWRVEAKQRIDRHRKADLTITVTDALGKAIPGVTVDVEQLRHAYPFGTAIVSARLMNSPRPDIEADQRDQWEADNLLYREKVLELFNTVVTENDLKWPQWSSAADRPERYSQEWTLSALDWVKEQGFNVKGHCMIWASWRFTPKWLRAYENDLDALQSAVLTHIRDVGNATADRSDYWDVLNEPMSHRQLIELLGMDKVAEWFKEARAALPNVRLVMNEFDLVGNGGSPTRRQKFIEFYKELKERGAPLDIIGMQGHFWSERFTAPEDVWKIIDEVHEATGLPVMISEFDSNVPNEMLQADYTRDFLTAWFSHPATEAFIMWGFWGKAHWMGDSGAMYRGDWSEKPNLAAYKNLVFGEWWTREMQSTDAEGRVAIRAFHGRHRVTLTTADGKILIREVDVPAEGRTLHVSIPY